MHIFKFVLLLIPTSSHLSVSLLLDVADVKAETWYYPLLHWQTPVHQEMTCTDGTGKACAIVSA